MRAVGCNFLSPCKSPTSTSVVFTLQLMFSVPALSSRMHTPAVRTLHFSPFPLPFRGVATGWTGVHTSTPLFPRAFLGLSRRGAYTDKPYIVSPDPPYLDFGGTSFPYPTHTVHPTLFDLATPCSHRNTPVIYGIV